MKSSIAGFGYGITCVLCHRSFYKVQMLDADFPCIAFPLFRVRVRARVRVRVRARVRVRFVFCSFGFSFTEYICAAAFDMW